MLQYLVNEETGVVQMHYMEVKGEAQDLLFGGFALVDFALESLGLEDSRSE